MDAWEPHHLLWSCAATAHFSVAGGSPASATVTGYRTVAELAKSHAGAGLVWGWRGLSSKNRTRGGPCLRPAEARADAARAAAKPAARRRRGRTPRPPDRPPG